MKTHRILGILWLALCSYCGFETLPALFPVHTDTVIRNFSWYYLAFSCLIYLAGVVASIFLLRGKREARWIVGSVAAFMVLSIIATIYTVGSVSILSAVFGLFAVVSLMLLFFPKHEPVG
jgi:hypothetical protein